MLAINKDSLKTQIVSNLLIIKNEVRSEAKKSKYEFNQIDKLQYETINSGLLDNTVAYLQELNIGYGEKFLKVEEKRNRLMEKRIKKAKDETLLDIEKKYTNENLNDLVFKTTEKNKVTIENNRLIQNIDPIYKDPKPKNALDFRTHIFAPKKHFLGMYFSTFSFNIMVIWTMSLLLFLTLYFETYNRILAMINKITK
jgi:ABC transport system ATP-binding/permease protein